jgi:hypothetical protein
MGPVVLFDKSFIEMLNLDEAAIFDFMFSSNICPIFLTEVLADLEKEKPGERTREKVVADVANKTPVAHSYPNLMHSSLCLSELGGRPIEMNRFPIFGGGQPVRMTARSVCIIARVRKWLLSIVGRRASSLRSNVISPEDGEPNSLRLICERRRRSRTVLWRFNRNLAICRSIR